jgi:hypothetical protein
MRTLMFAAASATVLALQPVAFAQQADIREKLTGHRFPDQNAARYEQEAEHHALEGTG